MRAAIEVVPFDGLSAHDLDAWRRLQLSNPALTSPFFHPAYAAAVHQVWYDVEVAVVRSTAGDPVSILPVQVRRGVARPVGWPATDFQGPIAAPDTQVDAHDVPRRVGWRAYRFDHLLAVNEGFAGHVEAVHQSPVIDTRGGLDGYLGRASKTGRDNIRQARRRLNKAERELGAIRFVDDSTDRDLLGSVVQLKRAQYRATGASDYFAADGRGDFLELVLAGRDPDFSGALSGLYAGDQLIAAHFGMRSNGVLHWWFPVYDPAFSRLGPGWLLLWKLIESAPSAGLELIDLGRGDDEYKRRAKTGDVTVWEGGIESSRAVARLRAGRRRLETVVRQSPVGPAATSAAKQVRSWLGR